MHLMPRRTLSWHIKVYKNRRVEKMKTIISYPGAKWRFYEHMKPYFPLDMETYIEPFFGGGSVGLSIAADQDFCNISRMIVGDLAPEIWALWKGCRDHAEEVVDTARKMFDSRNTLHGEIKQCIEGTEEYNRLYERVIEEAREFWKWTQEVDTSTMSLVERAARTFLVNRISFSGMGDSGSLSKERYLAYHHEMMDGIIENQKYLQRMEILNVPFQETIKYASEKPDKTFVFLDPPYYKQESSGLYGRNGDTHKGFPHDEFAETTKKLPCKWFVTYDDSVKVRQMFSGCHIKPFRIDGGYVMAMRTAEDALAGEELFITNYDITGNSSTNEELMSLL